MMFDNRNKLLLIEDDPAIATSLTRGLEREGFMVTWKDEGKKGIAHAAKNPPDLILLDVRLPDGSGFDVCHKMRAMKMRQPIIMLTVYNEELDKVLGLEMGADDYVTKPFSLRELISRIRALLRRAYGELSSSEGDMVYIDDLIIDRMKGQVQRGETPINLSPIEYRLLLYLSQHPNQVVSRKQIIEAVWGVEAGFMDERAINVNIRRLREKLELDPANPRLLLTIPGIGYRLKK